MVKYTGADRRRHVRVKSRITVQFRLQSLDKTRFLSDWLIGFTRDIGKGGVCLLVNNLNSDFAQLIKDRQVRIALELEMPLIRKHVSVLSRVAWIKESADESNKYSLGLTYDEAGKVKVFPVLAVLIGKYLTIILILLFLLMISFLINGR